MGIGSPYKVHKQGVLWESLQSLSYVVYTWEKFVKKSAHILVSYCLSEIIHSKQWCLNVLLRGLINQPLFGITPPRNLLLYVENCRKRTGLIFFLCSSAIERFLLLLNISKTQYQIKLSPPTNSLLSLRKLRFFIIYISKLQ